MTMARMTLFSDAPSTATIASAMINPGNAINASTTRWADISMMPPAYARATPMMKLAVIPMRTLPRPT